jgi:hypothetical protein
MPDNDSLQPGESRKFQFHGVPREALQSAHVLITFHCKCGIKHSGTIPALTGGVIRRACRCGHEINLEIHRRQIPLANPERP